LIRRLNPKYINTQNKTVHFRSIGRISGEPPPALFVLDGVPQEASYRYLLDINPNNIHSVTALIGPGGFYFYGEEAIGGVVFVETKLNNLGNDFETGGDKWTGSNLGKVIQLFRPTVEFYNPPLEIVNNSPEYWIRPTLYLNPDVFYDGQEPVTIRYYNHKKKGKVAIIVNGVTIHGEPISGVYKYNIR